MMQRLVVGGVNCSCFANVSVAHDMQFPETMIEDEHRSWNYEHHFRKLKHVIVRDGDGSFKKADGIESDKADCAGHETGNPGFSGKLKTRHDFFERGERVALKPEIGGAAVLGYGRGSVATFE